MAAATSLKRFYGAHQLGMTATNFTAATWAQDFASNISNFLKSAADDTSLIYIPVPPSPSGQYGEDRQVSVIKIPYVVGTADLDAAPTVVLGVDLVGRIVEDIDLNAQDVVVIGNDVESIIERESGIVGRTSRNPP